MAKDKEYERFIRSKARMAQSVGFDVDESSLTDALFPWQKCVVRWALKRGRGALLEECGLGKTFQQLSWGEQIVARERKPVILLCPIGVRQQSIQEAAKFGIRCDVSKADSQSDVNGPGIFVSNYEKLHKFDASKFIGVILDESSCLKEFKSTTKKALCEAFAETRYRLACTATPSPNEYMELGNHSEFLGVMPSREMLSRWFIRSFKAGEYGLLRHAEVDFWRWVCSWAVCVSKPSDLGDFSDEAFNLPPIHYEFVTVEIEEEPALGELFNNRPINAINMHQDKRASAEKRAAAVREIIFREDPDCHEKWLIWCDTDYEQSALEDMFPGIQVSSIRGSNTDRQKEDRESAWRLNDTQIMISKPTIFGFGMNWQHCRNAIFVGLSYSFEQFYQATKRIYRFGQTQDVRIWIVQSEAEAIIADAVLRKQNAHVKMQSSMATAMTSTQIEMMVNDVTLAKYRPETRMELPSWLKRSAKK